MQMWATFAIVSIAIALFASEVVALEVVALGVIVALLLLFNFVPLIDADGVDLLPPGEIVAGFANPALLSILALLVIGQGLHQSGALDGLITRLTAAGRARRGLTLAATLLFAGLISAFMNNTPIVVMFIPVVAALASRFRGGAGTVLMPLSYLAILGGMLTLIGSSTNLLVADLAQPALGRAMGFFELLVPGAMLAAVGAFYTLLVAPRLLAKHAGNADLDSDDQGRQFIAQLDITPSHSLVGARSVAGMFRQLEGITVRMIVRHGRPILPPFEDIVLEPGDKVVMATTRRLLMAALDIPQHVHAKTNANERQPDGQSPQRQPWLVAEAAVAPGSRLSGRLLSPAAFWSRTGCRIIGVQRNKRMGRSQLEEIRLQNGDVLLITGPRQPLRQLRRDRDLLILEGSISDLPGMFSARWAMVIFALTIFLSATGLAPIVVATTTGALAMVASGCLNIQQATRAINLQIVLLVAAGIAMASALQDTGGANYLANVMLSAVDGASTSSVLAVLFLLVAVMTNILSNNATALIFTPIAVSTALQMGADPVPFVHAVIFAANCSFISPIGYQTNLLVMGPGNYRYVDFVKVGTPLALLVWLTVCLVAPRYYGF